MSKWFAAIANRTADASGKWPAFITAVVLVIGWAASGPLFHFSDTWELVINTATTIVTFLMVFLLQHAANTSNAATQLKLDELLLTSREARNDLVTVEDDEPDVIAELQAEMRKAAKTGESQGEPQPDVAERLAQGQDQ